MGTGPLNTAVDGTPIPAADNNALVAALKQDLVPRNNSAVAEANAGNLGTNTYPWDRANISTGYFVCGDVKMFNDYNGLLSPGHGWMKMNGDIVNEANYDAIHGAGAWDEFIGSSPLDGKYLPNMNDKVPVGKADTDQAGGVAITFEGNANHQVSSSNHTHTGPSHNHMWHKETGIGGTSPNQTFDASGNLRNDSSNAAKSGGVAYLAANVNTTPSYGNDAYTSKDGTGNTGAAGGETLNIKPHSCAFEFWMRII